MNAQTNIFAALTETNAAAAAISAEVEAKKEAKKKPAAKKEAKPAAAAKKPAAKKATKTEAATMPEESKPAAAPIFDAEAVRVQFIESLILREADAPLSKTLPTDRAFFEKDPKFARDMLTTAHGIGFDVEDIAKRCALTDKKQAGFIGMKVITKIRQLLTASHTGIARDCDGYTYAILVNMVETQTALDVHDMMRCVSKKVAQNDMLRSNTNVQALKNSSANTADTQTSSTRMMLGELGVLMVNKGRKGDRPEWATTSQALHVRAMFEKHCNG